jgi:UPF0755 protein
VREFARLCATLVVLLTLAVAISALYLRTLLSAAADGDPPRTFIVEPGAGFSSVAGRLQSDGLIQSALALKILARVKQVDTQLKAGEYELSGAHTSIEILRQLTDGIVKTYSVVLPEGLRAREIAERLEIAGLANAQEIMRAVRDPNFARSVGIEADSLEGYLFPSTYYFARGLSGQEILRTLVGQFQREWKAIEPDAKASGMSRHQIVVLASIVEKETGAPDERPLIAAVFLNRLTKQMRLETDPTVIYGIENFDGNLKRSHLEDSNNLYNTYRHAGLPPGPIANPGAAALRAIVQPAETDFLYFVSRNDGTHKFSATYRQHVNAVNQFQRRRRN